MEALKGLGNEKVEQIIVEVQQNRFLWDRAVQDYKDIELKEATWSNIAETVELPAERVKKVWSSLRDTYTRYARFDKKAALDGSVASGRGRIESWRWARAMEFYSTAVCWRRAATYISSSTVNQASEIQFKDEEVSDDESGIDAYRNNSWAYNQVETADDIQDPVTNQIVTPTTGKRKRAAADDEDENLYNNVVYFQNRHDDDSYKEEVADRQWLLSLLPNFKGMTLPQKNLLKYKIQGLFVESEAQHQQPTQSHFR